MIKSLCISAVQNVLFLKYLHSMQPTTSKAMLTVINIIYFAILSMMVLFSVVVYYLVSSGSITPDPEALPPVIKYILYAIASAGVTAAYFVNRQMLSQVDHSQGLRSKLGQYQTVMIIRSACLEAPGLFGAVCTFLTGNLSFLVVTGLMAVLFLLWRPTTDSIRQDLQLTESEGSVLADPDGVIE